MADETYANPQRHYNPSLGQPTLPASIPSEAAPAATPVAPTTPADVAGGQPSTMIGADNPYMRAAAIFMAVAAGESYKDPLSPTASQPQDAFNQAADQGTRGTQGVQTGAFAHDLLVHAGLPVTPENVRAISAWMQAEGTKAAFNPLATTQRAPGAGDFNKVGVKNFTSYQQGVDVTAQVLFNGKYGNIIDALRKGDNAMAVAQAIAASPWGTGSLVEKVLGGR